MGPERQPDQQVGRRQRLHPGLRKPPHTRRNRPPVGSRTIVEHVYDADGNRVLTKTTKPGQPTDTTAFLVDTSGGLSHVVAKIDGTVGSEGTLETLYIRGGDELLALILQRFSAWCTERALTRPSEATKPILERYQRWLFHYRRVGGGPIGFRSQAMAITTQIHTRVAIHKLEAIHDATHPGARLPPRVAQTGVSSSAVPSSVRPTEEILAALAAEAAEEEQE